MGVWTTSRQTFRNVCTVQKHNKRKLRKININTSLTYNRIYIYTQIGAKRNKS